MVQASCGAVACPWAPETCTLLPQTWSPPGTGFNDCFCTGKAWYTLGAQETSGERITYKLSDPLWLQFAEPPRVASLMGGFVDPQDRGAHAVAGGEL